MLQLLPTLRSNLLRPICKDAPHKFSAMVLPHQALKHQKVKKQLLGVKAGWLIDQISIAIDNFGTF